MSQLLSKVSKEEQDTLELLTRYKRDPSSSIKNKIVKLNLQQVKKIAKTYSDGNVDNYNDLVQVGCLGLLNAIERFDLNQNASFKTYATHLIAGEIKHYLRDHSSMIRPPRELQELKPKINKAKQILSNVNNEDPDIKEIADFLNIPIDKISQVFEMEYSSIMLSFEQKIQQTDDSSTYAEIIEDKKYSNFQNIQEDRILISQAFNSIEEKSREIIEYAFYEDLSQTEIAKKMGLSQMQVSRKIKSALKEVWDILNSRVTPW
ncbi:MAG: sigma-70 family RNA polymerase sigma factor [Candidatus Sericytochromatia bacterium]